MPSKIVPGDQKTVCQNRQSDQVEVTSGLLQGSILGTLLFLIFIIDPPDANPKLESYGFADDFRLIAMTNMN